MYAPSPTVIGARRIVSEPMNAPSPMTVLCFCAAVEVGGDGAGADVHVLAHLGIAQVREVVLLGARAEARVLLLRVVADLGAVTHLAAGSQVGEGPDVDVVADTRRSRSTLAQITQRSPIVELMIWLPDLITVSCPIRVSPRRITSGSSVTSGSISTVASITLLDPSMVTPDELQPLDDRRLHEVARLFQVGAIVDAAQRPFVGRVFLRPRHGRAALVGRDLDQARSGTAHPWSPTA